MKCLVLTLARCSPSILKICMMYKYYVLITVSIISQLVVFSCSIFFPMVKERKSGMGYIKMSQTSLLMLTYSFKKKKKKRLLTRFIFTEILIFLYHFQWMTKLNCIVHRYLYRRIFSMPQCFCIRLYCVCISHGLVSFSCLHFSEGRRDFFLLWSVTCFVCG